MEFKQSIIIVLIFSNFLNLKGQDTNALDSIPKIELKTITHVNQGNSYVTFPTDIGNIEPLMFEANLIPNFLIKTSKDARLMGVLTGQIIIRMYNEFSYPVRTPSYMPQITAYYRLSDYTQIKQLSTFARFVHHSNGQDENFFLDDGSINVESGDFSTNYIEAGLTKTFYNSRFKAVQFFSTSFAYHPPEVSSVELDGIYSFYRWNSSFSVFKLPEKAKDGKKKARFLLKADATWMFGEVNDWKNVSINRLNMSFIAFYSPKFLEDIGFFMQFYHGMDYYNMYFNHQLDVFRLGIMTEILRF